MNAPHRGHSVTCDLCNQPGGGMLWQDERCRIIRVQGSEGDAFPGFCRVVWREHVKEMSDLSTTDRRHLWNVLQATELMVRETLQPDKINLASFGNMVPHLHWHVIPRWTDDSHFPGAIWAATQRSAPTRPAVDDATLVRALQAALAQVESEA